jgi:predicted nucleotidyltransferase
MAQFRQEVLHIVTKMGTIVLKMSTPIETDKLSASLFGKTRRAILSLLYSHPDEAFYLRQLVRAAGVGLGGVQREVRRLSEAGIIRRMVRGRQVYYQANSQSPVFEELRSLVIKTAGVGDVLRAAMAPLMERINLAFIYGSVARGEERRGSDLDVLVVGDVTFTEITSALSRAQETLRRDINPTVYPPTEFRSKLAAGHHFIETVLKETKIFLIGDESELARLAGKRLAD